MAKTRIGERLSDATQASEKKNRSHELATYIEKYEAFTKAYKPLKTVLKNHHTNMQKLDKSHEEVNYFIGFILSC